MQKAQFLRYTEVVRHHTEAVFHPGKLLLCGDPNELSGELNQRYDARFLLTGELSQRSGGGMERWGGEEFRENNLTGIKYFLFK